MNTESISSTAQVRTDIKTIMVSIKFLFFFALAIACVIAYPAEESARAKKQIYSAYTPLGYSAYSAGVPYAAAPLAYSAPYTAAAYTGYGYAGYPYYY